jgi:ribosomal protein S18 acetylase RimI-like enzyme
VVGYGLLLLPPLPRPARLYSLAVVQAWRGRGVGERLLRSMLDEARARGYRRVRLEVRRASAGVQALYSRSGFHEIADLPGYYEDGGDGLRMEALLDR